MEDLNSASTYIYFRDEDGSTFLHLASLACNSESVKLFIDAGADVNAVDKSGFTPLHNAIREGVSETVRKVDEGSTQATKDLTALIAAGADIKAAREGNIEVVKALIAAGADVNARDESGSTPLHYTWQRGKTEAIKVLIASGADINAMDKDGQTPLYLAAGHKSLESIKVLIAAGADINLRDKYGYTPLDTGLRQGITSETAKALIAGGADVNSVSGMFKFTPLHLALSHAYLVPSTSLQELPSLENAEILKALIYAGADINAKARDGKTPLHYAACINNVDITKILIEAGADINVKHKGNFLSSGKTPLEIARSESNTEVVEVLEAAENIYAKDC